jgi:hypothetical protein
MRLTDYLDAKAREVEVAAGFQEGSLRAYKDMAYIYRFLRKYNDHKMQRILFIFYVQRMYEIDKSRLNLLNEEEKGRYSAFRDVLDKIRPERV